ncbi:serine hydrolase domain-containing protein [Paenibacillus ehimensis]|uniref:Serine hydrolase domain-containing protein n=1 Tax=Paenibacillus ehimensis TaxID=79264 RepID=A0ABT8V6Y3_9BACL|nr:serine hydrolase domain-containing protein [Paenibacillus ehimensis]MDO3677186.1 serine hydrolase domain-containing protein [Paenibacillus ehimensis]
MKIFCAKINHIFHLMSIVIVWVVSPLSAKAEAKTFQIDPAKIDAYVEAAMDRLHIPGAALAIVKGDRTVYLKGYGISGPDQAPVTPQTPFVLGSTSKSFTALAVMQLAEAGKIELEAPVQRYLPYFRTADEAASSQITVRHLLNQTSGFSTYTGRKGMVEGDKSIEQHIRDLKNTPLARPAGSGYEYSNVNYNILSGIVQAVSGKPYAQYVSDHIFKPLAMNHSYAAPDPARSDGLATGYQPVFGYMVPTKQWNHEATVASGYLISSAEDMANYLIAQLNGGRFQARTVLSEQGVRQMHEPAAPIADGLFYGMGWSVNNSVIFHNGITENTYSFMAMDGDYGIVLLINAYDFLSSYDSIASGLNGIVHGQERSAAELPDYTKTYLILDLIMAVILALLVRSVYSLWTWKTKFKATPLRITVHAVSILFLNVLLPLAVLIYFPKLDPAPWSVVTLFFPGAGHALLFIPIVLLGVGAIKTVLLLRSGLGSKRPASRRVSG